MSRKQWGHGYWKGVNDARNGTAPLDDEDLRDMAEMHVLRMCDNNSRKMYDRSLFPVSEHKAMAWFSGIENTVIPIYNYIFHNEPFGCYVSGHRNAPPEDDYYVLPNMDEKEIEEERKIIIDRWNSRHPDRQAVKGQVILF